MRVSSLVLVAPLLACATTPDPPPDPCKAQGRRYVKEAYSAGGHSLTERDDGVEGGVAGGTPARSGLGGLVLGEAYGVGGLGVVGQGKGTVGKGSSADVLGKGEGSKIVSIFGRDSDTPKDSAELFQGAQIADVHIAHQTMGRGGKADSKITFTVPAPARLEATTSVKGYHGFTLNIGPWSRGAAAFWVGCRQERAEPHTVDWTFTLRDDQGRRSNSVKFPVECTGREMPGRAPILEAVDLDSQDLIGGGRTGGVARFSGTHPPVQLVARSDTSGYGWTGSPNQNATGQQSFSVGCRKEKQLHSVRWRFLIKDSFGRESNVVEKVVHCGLCVEE